MHFSARLKTWIVVVALLVASNAKSFAAQPQGAREPHRYSITGWDTERGLPSNAVLDVLQASDGYIWIASYQGLIRFDGVTFKMFTQDDIPGLVRASFWGIVESPKGTIWAATESDGLVRYRDGNWKIFKVADGLKSDKTTFLQEGENGEIWLGSRRGVVRISGDHIEKIPAPEVAEEPNVTAIAFVDHKLYIGTAAAGMLEYSNGRYRQYRVADGLDDDRVTGLFADRDGTLWIGAYGRGIMRFKDGKFSRIGEAAANPPTRINRFFQQGNIIWVAAENGLFRVDGENVEEIKQNNGREFVQMESIRADTEGNLWAGSRQTGLYRLREPSFETYAQGNGLENELIYSIEPDGADGLWVGTLHGLVHATPRGNSIFSGWKNDKGEDLTRDVLRDPNGDIWAATNGGLIQLHNGKSRLYNQKDGLADDRCRVLLRDSSGDLWIGTFNGLSRMHQGKFQNYGAADGLSDSYILSLFLDSHNVLWVGTQSEGAFRFNGTRFDVAPAQLSQEPVFRMTESADGTIWAGTSRGLVRMKDGKTHRFTTREGLPGNTIFQAIDDGNGLMWLTGPWGVARVHKSSLEDVVSGREKMVISKQFGRGDGLTSREVSSVSKSWASKDGRIYFATPLGISVLRPNRVQTNPAPPRVYVEQVIGDDSQFDRSAAISMPPGTRHLEFRYAAPSFASPESLHFRYRLVGFDTDWVEAGARRSAFYTNLGPGKYTFQVLARNEDGTWSPAAAEVAFQVRAHFWQTRWFLVLAILVVVGLALATHKIRIKAVQFAVRHQWLENLSMNDELTGLRNRRGFMLLAEQQLRVSERTKQPFDVVFIDLDGLKKINDEYGHSQGDQALKDTADLLRKTFRESDIICRYGGDEFAAIVIDDAAGVINRPDRVQAPCERLQSAVREFNSRTGRPYRLSLSTGMSHYDPEIPTTLQVMLESADLGMYSEKRSRR